MNEFLVAIGTVLLALVTPLLLIAEIIAGSLYDPENPSRSNRRKNQLKLVAVGIPSFFGGVIAAIGIAWDSGLCTLV